MAPKIGPPEPSTSGGVLELSRPATRRQRPAPCSQGLAVVVDSSPRVCGMVCEVMQKHHFATVVTADGREALALLRDQPASVDILVTGVVVPGLTGLELAHRLRESCAHLRVIYMSARTDVVQVGGVLDVASDFLRKPFTRRQLVSKVNALLARPGRRPAGRAQRVRP